MDCLRRSSRRVVLARTLLPLTCVIAGLAVAGPLSPSAGPVASSYKTLGEVEPRIAINATNTPGNGTNVFIISQPGSYYLTGNVNVPTGKNGISVAASRVTIDLNGYSIIGVTGSLDGVVTPGSPAVVTVQNGSVTNCQNGIAMNGTPVATVANVRLYGNRAKGVEVGNASVVRDCVATNTTTIAFSSAGGARFERCQAFWSQTGFNGPYGDVFNSCVAANNSGVGFNVGNNGRVMNCQALDNGQQGIVCVNTNWISGCDVLGNGGISFAGIWLNGTYNHCEGNNVANNGYGIFAGAAGNFIYRNKVGSSTQVNFYAMPGNHVGTIGVASSNGAIISGDTGGGMGALENDPNANLVY